MMIDNYLLKSNIDGHVKLVCPLQWNKNKHQWKPKWDVIEYIPYQYNSDNISLVSELIRTNLTSDLLASKYIEGNFRNALYGHCFHATQTMYYLMQTNLLVSMRGIDAVGEHHWWLMDKTTEIIIDVTGGQYDAFDYSPPYINGKKTAWYTFKKTPKIQTLNLIQKVLPLSIRYITQSPHDNYQTLDAFM